MAASLPLPDGHQDFPGEISTLLAAARKQTARAINSVLVATYGELDGVAKSPNPRDLPPGIQQVISSPAARERVFANASNLAEESLSSNRQARSGPGMENNCCSAFPLIWVNGLAGDFPSTIWRSCVFSLWPIRSRQFPRPRLGNWPESAHRPEVEVITDWYY